MQQKQSLSYVRTGTRLCKSAWKMKSKNENVEIAGRLWVIFSVTRHVHCYRGKPRGKRF